MFSRVVAATRLDLGMAFAAVALVFVCGTLAGTVPAGTTVWVEGERFTWGRAVLTTLAGATNAGTIRLETTSSDGFDRGSYLVADATGLTNLPGAAIEANPGEIKKTALVLSSYVLRLAKIVPTTSEGQPP